MISSELTFEPQSPLHQKLRLFRWAVPLSFALISVFYQLVVANLVHDVFGNITHLLIEILFYGTVGPFAAFWVIQLISKWLGE